MHFAFVGYHAPLAHGTAAGRQLHAVGEALLAEGHEVTAWCWQPAAPRAELPAWAQWRPVRTAAAWRVRSRSLLAPRTDLARSGWVPPAGAVVIADDPVSYGALRHAPTSVVTVHYATALDRAAMRDWSPARVQDLRGERRATRAAGAVWTLSQRVADHLGRGTVVPATLPLPPAVVPLVEEPVAALLADWDWAPNRRAAESLLRDWPRVRERVPGARLLLAGRGRNPVGPIAGVEWRGEVTSTSDLLADTAVFVFPCPTTSGPKMKSLDALAHGVPLLTTPAGVEGILDGTAAAAVAPQEALVDRLVELLSDPARRAPLAAAGRSAVERGHAPSVAARARVHAVEASSAAAGR